MQVFFYKNNVHKHNYLTSKKYINKIPEVIIPPINDIPFKKNQIHLALID